MMNSRDQLVTIIGEHYFQPIADLLFRLLEHPKPNPNEVSAGYYENGYCASTVLLVVAMLESYVMRVRYINRDRVPIKRVSVPDYLHDLYSDYEHHDQLTEVFVIRDLVTHNHLWEVDFTWGDETVMELRQAERARSAGDNKYRRVVDEQSLRTQSLGLNVLPTKIGRQDLLTVFDTVWCTLLFLENKNRNQCYVSHLGVRFGRARRVFSELRDYLRSAL